MSENTFHTNMNRWISRIDENNAILCSLCKNSFPFKRSGDVLADRYNRRAQTSASHWVHLETMLLLKNTNEVIEIGRKELSKNQNDRVEIMIKFQQYEKRMMRLNSLVSTYKRHLEDNRTEFRSEIDLFDHSLHFLKGILKNVRMFGKLKNPLIDELNI